MILLIVVELMHISVTDFFSVARLFKTVEFVNLTHTLTNKGAQALESTCSQMLNAKELANLYPAAVEQWDLVPINECSQNF